MFRLLIPIQILLMWIIAMGTWFQIAPFDLGALDTWAALIGIILEVLSLLLLGAGILAMRRDFTIQIAPRHRLVTTGVFHYSRNPIYLAALGMTCGWVLQDRSSVVLGAMLGLFFLLNLKIRMEEKELRKKFGDEYFRYQTSTSRWWTLKRRG